MENLYETEEVQGVQGTSKISQSMSLENLFCIAIQEALKS